MTRNTLLQAGVATLAALGLAAAVPAHAQTPFFTSGNLVVSQVGTGSGTLSSTSVAEFLDQFTIAGTSVNSLALPTADSGTTHAITDSGSATSDGFLTLSTDGTALTIQGYDAAPGTASVASTAGIARDVAVVNAAGSINTSTVFTDAYAGNNLRSSALSGSTLYLGGADTQTGGTGAIHATTVAGTSTTTVETAQKNGRNVNVFSSNVYFSSGSTGNVGINQINSDGTVTLLAADTTGKSPYDFYFADPNTLYIADDASITNGGGLQKYTYNGTSFVLSYDLTTNLTAGLRGLTGVTVGGVTTLYATTADTISGTAGNKLVAITDSGSTSAFTTLATAVGNEAFRGVDFAPVAAVAAAPEPSGIVALALGAGVLGLMVVRRRKVAA